jgi:hypothetical protein
MRDRLENCDDLIGNDIPGAFQKIEDILLDLKLPDPEEASKAA